MFRKPKQKFFCRVLFEVRQRERETRQGEKKDYLNSTKITRDDERKG